MKRGSGRPRPRSVLGHVATRSDVVASALVFGHVLSQKSTDFVGVAPKAKLSLLADI